MLHAVHAAARVPDTLPFSHEVQLAALPLEYVPALHAEHSWRPASAANSPGLHGLHAELAAASAYLPSPHSSQAVAPGAEVWPTVHVSHVV